VKLVYLFGFITKKLVTMHGHMKFEGMREKISSYILCGCCYFYRCVFMPWIWTKTNTDAKQ